MEAWVIGIILAVVEVIITTAAGFIVTRILAKREKEKEELAKLREERRIASEQQRCEIVKNTIHTEIVQLEQELAKKSVERYADLKQDISGVKEDLALVKTGLQNDLYVDLVRLRDEYVLIKGYATRDNKRDYDTLYNNYHNLGKNGIADGMHTEVLALPEVPKGE